MKITFPHMGNLSIPLETVFRQLGIEVVLPPSTTKKTISLGVQYSPEQICLPFKYILGNLIEGHQQGADTIVMLGGCGPCRFGFYGNLSKEILEDLGLDFKFVYFDEHLLSTLFEFKYHSKFSWLKIYPALLLGWHKLILIEHLEDLACTHRPFFSNMELMDFENHIEFILQEIKRANSQKELRDIQKLLERDSYFCKEKILNHQLVKVALIGDIYTLLEPQCNFNINKELGRRGVQVINTTKVSTWIINSLVGLKHTREGRNILSYAKPYLKEPVGGHGLHSVANSNMLASQVDGLVQLMPLTCTPEIVAASIIPTVSSQKKIPVLKLFIDEHTADTGFFTRIEAFVDLLTRKNDKKKVNGFEYVN